MSTLSDRFTYLDANAAEPIRPEALEAMTQAALVAGNPASVHRAGRKARAVLETAREDIAALFGAAAENCVFTSGGTEANVLAIAGQAGGRRVLVGASEHDAVRAATLSATIPVRADGVLDLAALERMLAAGGHPRWSAPCWPITRPASSTPCARSLTCATPMARCCMWMRCRRQGASLLA